MLFGLIFFRRDAASFVGQASGTFSWEKACCSPHRQILWHPQVVPAESERRSLPTKARSRFQKALGSAHRARLQAARPLAIAPKKCNLDWNNSREGDRRSDITHLSRSAHTALTRAHQPCLPGGACPCATAFCCIWTQANQLKGSFSWSLAAPVNQAARSCESRVVLHAATPSLPWHHFPMDHALSIPNPHSPFPGSLLPSMDSLPSRELCLAAAAPSTSSGAAGPQHQHVTAAAPPGGHLAAQSTCRGRRG